MIITVYGDPAPQGSKRALGRSPAGKSIMVENSTKVIPWRNDVKNAAERAVAALGMPPPMDGPLLARMVFTYPRPKSHFGTGKNSDRLRPDAPERPCTVPDLSKLVRSTEDAIKGLVWVDDARVSEYSRVAKVWVNEDIEALDRRGVIITVVPIGRRDDNGSEIHVLESGQTLVTHSLANCRRNPWCVIHVPRPGPWESWPRLWRDDRMMIERVCPHGVGHPAVEQIEWFQEHPERHSLDHGCDLCPCMPRELGR
jgi:Holliday junction resolvase RusA-like endonuclease